MNMYTVSLFGHREIENLWRMEDQLSFLLRELIQTNTYINFLIGRHGEFDEYAASMIKHAQKEIGNGNSDITLVLPYRVADLEYYEKYYDDIVIPENVYGVHPKSAITLKNRWMVEHSDLVLVYVERKKGGAYAAMKYAEKMNKRIINLYTGEGFSLSK